MNRTLSFFNFSTLSRIIAILLLSQGSTLALPMNTSPVNYYSYLRYKFPECKEYPMIVYMKDGKIIQKPLVLYIKNLIEYKQFLKIGQEKIIPSKTDSIIASGFVGLPVKNTWAWRTISGKLNIYTGEPGTGGEDYNFLDKRDKSLAFKSYSIDALQDAVSDNLEALSLVKSYRKGKTIGYSLLIGGGALALGGLGVYAANQEHSGAAPSIAFFSGCIIAISSTIPFHKVRKKVKQAIETYNSSEQIK
jgi:hypothetical protein